MFGKHLSGFGALFLYPPSLQLKRKCLFAFLRKRETSRKFVHFHKKSENCNMAKIRQKNLSAYFRFRDNFPENRANFLVLQIFSQKVPFVLTNCEYFCLLLLKHPRKICICLFSRLYFNFLILSEIQKVFL